MRRRPPPGTSSRTKAYCAPKSGRTCSTMRCPTSSTSRVSVRRWATRASASASRRRCSLSPRTRALSRARAAWSANMDRSRSSSGVRTRPCEYPTASAPRDRPPTPKGTATVAPDLGQGPRGFLRELALGDVGDRCDDRGLAGESQALGGQQRVTDFAGALPEAHLDISHGALLFQEPDDLVALLERHPEAEVTDRPPDHLLSAESEKAGELLVHVQDPALVKRAHAHGLRARVKDDGEPFLRAAQLLPGRFEEVGHAGGGGLSRPPFMVPGADVGSHDWTDRHFGGQFGGGESAMVSGAVREPDR